MIIVGIFFRFKDFLGSKYVLERISTAILFIIGIIIFYPICVFLLRSAVFFVFMAAFEFLILFQVIDRHVIFLINKYVAGYFLMFA